METQALGQIDQLARQIMADGRLDYTRQDGNTLFALLDVIEPLHRQWQGNGPWGHEPNLELYLAQWLIWLDGAYGWQHAHQTPDQKAGVFRTFALMHIWFR